MFEDQSERGEQLSADQMTPLQEQRSRRTLGVARGAKFAAPPRLSKMRSEEKKR
jgi:hypothetical protein